ncbi:septal ring lytic transglycosylase RlpA family protein [bacterium]|nr:septal ring lytic transglycosylase RlpA family protein [bacterium]MBU1990346.1 septal ring lytic transglycosylase RlpA family protein [bacterium]
MNKFVFAFIFIFALVFSGCSTRGKGTYTKYNHPAPKTYSSSAGDHSSTLETKRYTHPTMRPYVVRGIRYRPTVVSVGDRFKGNASWYGPDFHGKLTSNGETYDMHDMTAAHKTLPMNTIVKVRNNENGRSTVVRINDRGPFVATRIIDLSKSAAKEIKMIGNGTASVTIEILGFQTKGKKTIPNNQELKQSPQEQSDAVFALQIASFSNIDGAIKTQEKYDNTDGYRTIIKDTTNDNGRIFKVCLKGFKSEEEARDYKEQSSFENAFIVMED